MTRPRTATPRTAHRTTRILVVRTDSDGDVLLAGPAIRAVARHAEVTLLVSPSGEQAARLLPGVAGVLVWPCPWSGFDPPAVDPAGTHALVTELATLEFDAAVILTSFHQSALPAALLLRLAGVPRIAAASEDYPGSLLDLRHRPAPGERHEVERSLDLVTAAGFPPAPDDVPVLAVRRPLPAADRFGLPAGPYVVVHPGASVPARAPDPRHAARINAALAAAGHAVVVTGGPRDRELTARVTDLTVRAVPAPGTGATAVRPGPGAVHDLGGRTTLAQLAAVLEAASCVVVGNTGPAHLAAAVATPVVSLFAPVVPAVRWRPWGVPHVLLGDQSAGCRDSRARTCPTSGHPCLSSVSPDDVVSAVARLVATPTGRADRMVEVTA
jgi:ADP-heptose:LPS heptosyltransferase